MEKDYEFYTDDLRINFTKWDHYNYLLPKKLFDLLEVKKGEEVGDLLSKFTKCPVRNSSCTNIIEVNFDGCGANRDPYYQRYAVWLCSIGAKNIDECALSK